MTEEAADDAVDDTIENMIENAIRRMQQIDEFETYDRIADYPATPRGAGKSKDFVPKILLHSAHASI